MRLTLIGMSGSGKSRWAKKLAEKGFKHFCCDELIALKLSQDLIKPDGNKISLGEWMGFPYEADYKEHESKYLSCEVEVLSEIISYLESIKSKKESDIVVDTTGSAIYTGDKILKKLRKNTTVVHLSTPAQVQEQMLKAYIADQRPVLWRNIFRRKQNETNDIALARCYPKLLSSREELYKLYANVTVGYYKHRDANFRVSNFLNEVFKKH